jgi:DnaK suppressor protein
MPKRIIKKIQAITEEYHKAKIAQKKSRNKQGIEYKKFEKALTKKEKRLKKQLKHFTRKRKSLKGDYKAKFPIFGRGKDEDAQEVERYESRLSMEHQLEIELEKVEQALQRIKAGTYGICLKCGKAISLARLEIYPEAEHCMNCHKKGL